ncbi:hypothetical protein [Rhodopseudomonas palustris]|jgi:hypothetical protein|uniref:hypothetical protein n=1 Tax=Rhodopseudomonas palustris TaxID=1076 RepID=UPI0002EAE234|nr:hypothetical protein [Rhodopseudomonas palustris]
MILVARNVVEQIAERGRKVTSSKEVEAGKTMPGYGTYEAAIRSQLDFREVEERGAAPNAPGVE